MASLKVLGIRSDSSLYSLAAYWSWCRPLQQQPPRHQANAHYPACPCWCRDLIVARAVHSAGNVSPESRGYCCWGVLPCNG